MGRVEKKLQNGNKGMDVRDFILQSVVVLNATVFANFL